MKPIYKVFLKIYFYVSTEVMYYLNTDLIEIKLILICNYLMNLKWETTLTILNLQE